MDFSYIESFLMTILINLPRVTAAFVMIPFFSREMLPGALIKNGIIMSVSMFLVPVNIATAEAMSLYTFDTLLLLLKEMFIGLVIGFLVAIPFWAIESVGFFIDNQRGATMASSLNPLTGSQTSPLGILLNQVSSTLFFVSGTFVLFMEGLYRSYKIWPLVSFIPEIKPTVVLFFIDQIGFMLLLAVVLSGPPIIAMFLSEFCFALINRFAPQLNVFVLSMPVKSAVGTFILIIYMHALFGYMHEDVGMIETVFSNAKRLLQ